MSPLVYLLMIAGLFLLGTAGELIFERTQIPDVVWLIAAGVVMRYTGLIDPEDLGPMVPLFAALTLIVVLFEGGSQLVVDRLVRAAPRASLLAIGTFVTATLAVAAALTVVAKTGVLGEEWTLTHGLMVGAILGGPSSLIIIPSMTLAKVEERVSNLVGLESAFTDALCVVVTVALIKIILSGEASAGATFLELAANFGIALAIGGAAGWVWMPILRILRGNQHAYPVTISALIFLYVIVDRAGGSAAMGILAFGVIVGNARSLMTLAGFAVGDDRFELDRTVRAVHSQATFIIKSFFFTFIGLMLAPKPAYLVLGAVLGLVLLVSRWPVVMLVVRGKEFDPINRRLVTVALPRGMAAGVLATMPAAEGVPGTEDLPAVVFSAVVTTILVFAIGFRRVRTQALARAGSQAPAPAPAAPESTTPPTPGAEMATVTAPPSPPQTAPTAIPPSGDH